MAGAKVKTGVRAAALSCNVTCTTLDCELCILERCRASFVQQDHTHLMT